MGIFDLLSSTIAIEAGSENTRMQKDGKLIYDEPTVLSIDTKDNRVTGIGKEVISTPPNILLEPFNYVISDFQGFESYLRGALNRADGKGSWLPKSYDMYFSIPIGTTEVEKRAFRDSAEHAGARSVYMMHSPVSSALGMGILFEQKNFILVDFSKSKFEVTIFCDSYPTSEATLRLGTQRLESLISNYIRRNHGITPSTDELRKLINGCLTAKQKESIQFKDIPYNEIEPLVDKYLTFVVDEITSCIESFDKPVKSEVLGKGVFFTGGGTLYNNICDTITKRIGLVANLSASPLVDSINGVAQIMKNPKNFEKYLMN